MYSLRSSTCGTFKKSQTRDAVSNRACYCGHLEAPNSNLIITIDLASQKAYKKTYYIP